MTRGEAVNWIFNISADIGKAEHRELWHYEQALLEIREMLESEPERKTGTWEKIHWKAYRCTECGKASEYITYFCPNCGAKMEVEHE